MVNKLVTGDTDLTAPGIPKRVSSWHFASAAGATINLRDGSVSGDIIAQIQLAVGTSASQSYDRPLLFPAGLFVDVVTGTIVGSVQLV